MLTFEGISQNFRFLVIQVVKQLETIRRFLADPSARLAKMIAESEEYVDVQKTMIENECFDFIAQGPVHDERVIDNVRALNVITANLERISDFSVNITAQMRHLGDRTVLQSYDWQGYIAAIDEGVRHIPEAVFGRNSALAYRICRVERDVDDRYRSDLQNIVRNLAMAERAADLVTTMFILHYMERMGDALLNVGEAAIFAITGERLKMHQYQTIGEAAAATPGLQDSRANVEMDSIWGTRSGVRIGTLETPDAEPGAGVRVLFKQGNPRKLQDEKRSLERWLDVAPGVAPRVVEYKEDDKGAALLLEYLDGAPYRDIVLSRDHNREAALGGLRAITRELGAIWRRTRAEKPANARYMRQLAARVDDIYRLHPALAGEDIGVGEFTLAGFPSLIERAAVLDSQLPAPFTVFIHGDLNLDNILFDVPADAVHFVDLHRSCDMDYVQDVSVFLVSAYRLPVFDPETRALLEQVAGEFLRFSREFAAEQADPTFEARLALGLARSFATSSRFELNGGFARSMHQRSSLLLNKLLHWDPDRWSEFRVPDSVLLY